MIIFDFQKNMMTSLATPELIAMASRPAGTVAATSAIVMGFNSQMLGLLFGSMTGAMHATSQLAKSEFDVPKLPKTLPNPFTFEWSFDGDVAPVKPAKRNAAKTKAPKAKPPVKAKPSAPEAITQVAPTVPASAALMPEDFVKPKAMTKPAKPDDLKLISGVGPKLESVLNSLGIWTFAQIAAWSPAEVAWVDDFLQFKGRIDRDGWIAQAETLATGK